MLSKTSVKAMRKASDEARRDRRAFGCSDMMLETSFILDLWDGLRRTPDRP
jgi:hypothetical protein